MSDTHLQWWRRRNAVNDDSQLIQRGAALSGTHLGGDSVLSGKWLVDGKIRRGDGCSSSYRCDVESSLRLILRPVKRFP